MSNSLNSTLLLTILLFIGLFFFLRASSKDRTTTVEVSSSKKPVEVLNLICNWLKLRGWKQIGGDSNKQMLSFKGQVISSKLLAIFLSILGGLGSCSLGLVIVQLYPKLNWWPILLGLIGGPLSGIIYSQKSSREEIFEFRLVDNKECKTTNLRLRAHRDELIALETELKEPLGLESDGSLFKTPI
tara:strand:+ start:25632 stop:26189 length:558 start_codon:yes stop_codon:yes gene_type:complete